MPKRLLLLCTALAVSACSEKDARPAKEVVAQAKGAAADAKQGAEAVAAKTDRVVTDAAQAVKDGVASAAQTTRTGADNVAQGVRELGEGGVVTGRVASFSGARLSLRPDSRGPDVLRVDEHTRYLLHGGTLGRAALPSGTRVKATYVVEAQVPVATEVEVLTR
jgi:hypothetical protein